MANIYRPISAEEAAATVIGSSSTVSNAKVVRVINTTTTPALVTLVANDQTTVVGSMSVAGNGELVIHKGADEYLFAGAATVFFTSIQNPKG